MTQEEFLEKMVNEDEVKFSIKDILEIYCECMDLYWSKSKAAHDLRTCCKEGLVNSIINGSMMTFFMSLYSSTLSEEDAIKLAKSVDGCFGMAVKEVKVQA